MKRREVAIPVLAVIGILVAGFVLRLAFLKSNLPVSYIFDEHVGLHLLARLNQGSLRPEFLHYPTFYYYVTYIVSAAFGDFNDIIVNGRFLNICFAVALGVLTAVLAYQIWRSSLAVVIAVLFGMFCPISIENGRYIITDILMSTLILASIICFTRYTSTESNWLRNAAWVLAGLATATKYTAGLLVVTFVIFELIWPRHSAAGFRVPVRLVQAVVIAVAAVLLIFFAFWPQDYLTGIVHSQGSSLAEVDQSDMAFLEDMRMRVLMLAVTAAVLAVAIIFSPLIADRFTNLWIYAGPAIALTIFLLCSPSVLLEPLRFVYDFGAEIKATTTKNPHMMWGYYVWVYWAHESLIVLGLCAIGIAMGLKVANARPALLFAAVYLFTIASAHRGYIRYLTPILPFIAIFAAGAISHGVRILRFRSEALAACAALAVVFLWGAEVSGRLYSMVVSAGHHNSHHASYTEIMKRSLSKITLMGVGPTFSLEQQGVEVKKVLPKAELFPKSAGSYLLIDSAAKEKLASQIDTFAFRLLWSDTRDTGQHLYIKATQ